jgi:hypothetical protein
VLQRIVLILGVALFAGAATAEPSSRPAPQPKPFTSLVPIAGAAGGLVSPRTR